MSAPDELSSPQGEAGAAQGARSHGRVVRSYENLAAQQSAPNLSPAPSMLSPQPSISHGSNKSLISSDRVPLDVVCVGLACVDIAGRPIRGPLKSNAVTLLEEVNLAGIVTINGLMSVTQRRPENALSRPNTLRCR